MYKLTSRSSAALKSYINNKFEKVGFFFASKGLVLQYEKNSLKLLPSDPLIIIIMLFNDNDK